LPPRTEAGTDRRLLARRNSLTTTARKAIPLKNLLPDGAVLLRTLFDEDDTLHWWALHRAGRRLEVLARGQSRPNALGRLEVATLVFDLDICLAWREYECEHLSLDCPDLSREARSALKFFVHLLDDAEFARLQLRTERMRERVRAAVFTALQELSLIEHWMPWAITGMLFLVFLFTPEEERESLPPGLYERWRQSLLPATPPPGQENHEAASDRRRAALDRATSRYLEAVAAEVNLKPLLDATQGRIDWAMTDVLFQVQGPLLAAPLAWLPFGERELFRQVASTSSVVSLTLRWLTEQDARRIGSVPRRLLSAQWLEKEDWQRMSGLAYLEAGLLRVGQRPANPWEVWCLGDNPLASVRHVEAALSDPDHPFGVAVIGGHGNVYEAGVSLADGLWRGEGVDLSRLDLLVLVACAVGRLRQQENRDVDGLYARLVTQGGRCVLAARWPIADTEAATFVTELVRQYVGEVEGKGGFMPFDRARALNQARRILLTEGDEAYRLSPHLASAFEIYGLS
jgi:hypothetical protein